MKLIETATLLSGLVTLGNGYAISSQGLNLDLNRRASSNSPNGYVPTRFNCPEVGPSIRNADSLSQNETKWLQNRKSNVVGPMRDFFSRLQMTDFDAAAYIDRVSNNDSAIPNIGIAVSGGGWRALTVGAGVIQAFDSRTDNATNRKQLGGLLQSSTYISGLSGGSWLLGSLYMNNFPTVSALQSSTGGNVWQFSNSILQGPANGLQSLSSAQYLGDIATDVQGKSTAGYAVSLSDALGRAISYQIINDTNGGPGYTWSSIAQDSSFQQGNMPFPIIVADGKLATDTSLNSTNTTIFEFNPYEMGSWDPTTFAFAPTQYLGSDFSNGVIDDESRCVVGFDNAGFIMGTSSSSFNQLILTINTSSLPSQVQSSLGNFLDSFKSSSSDVSDYSPNPFYQYHPDTNPFAASTHIALVDGGEDGENIPFEPLLQPEREVDVIFAIDASADTGNNWPNGSALVQTYERSRSSVTNGTNFPSIPDVNTIMNLGFNTRPTFFGCNASNFTSDAITNIPPIVVYLPNTPYTSYANESTFTLTTTNDYRDAMILNGYNVATMGNGSNVNWNISANWDQCVGCAILARSLERTNTALPGTCSQCFQEFCWDGRLDTSTPSFFSPTLNNPHQGGAGRYGISRLAYIIVGLTVVYGIMG